MLTKEQLEEMAEFANTYKGSILLSLQMASLHIRKLLDDREEILRQNQSLKDDLVAISRMDGKE